MRSCVTARGARRPCSPVRRDVKWLTALEPSYGTTARGGNRFANSRSKDNDACSWHWPERTRLASVRDRCGTSQPLVTRTSDGVGMHAADGERPAGGPTDLEDRAEIADVLAAFCERVDEYDIPGLGEVFTED